MDSIQPAGDPLNNAAHTLVRRVDLAEKANFSLPAGIRNRDSVHQLRDIDSDKCFSIICHGSSSCHADRLGQPAQPSDAQCRASHLTDRCGHMVLRTPAALEVTGSASSRQIIEHFLMPSAAELPRSIMKVYSRPETASVA